MYFKKVPGCWEIFRRLHGLVEYDFRRPNLGHDVRGGGIAEYTDLVETLADAQEKGMRFVLFNHGRAEVRKGETSMSALVRAEMQAGGITDLIIRSACIQHDEVFIAAVRPLPASDLLEVAAGESEYGQPQEAAFDTNTLVHEVDQGRFSPLPNHCVFDLTRPSLSLTGYNALYAAEAEVVAVLERAQRWGLAYAVLYHDAAPCKAGSTSMRAIVRRMMKDQCATRFLVRKACCTLERAFVAAIRPSLSGGVLVPLNNSCPSARTKRVAQLADFIEENRHSLRCSELYPFAYPLIARALLGSKTIL